VRAEGRSGPDHISAVLALSADVPALTVPLVFLLGAFGFSTIPR
jgi:hypothetical protein